MSKKRNGFEDETNEKERGTMSTIELLDSVVGPSLPPLNIMRVSGEWLKRIEGRLEHIEKMLEKGRRL